MNTDSPSPMEQVDDARTRLLPTEPCHVCKVTSARYRCPGCAIRFCSVPCSRAHKLATQCSGQRDRTVFVPTSQYNDVHMWSDLQFLDEIGRAVDNAERAPLATSTSSSTCGNARAGIPFKRKQLAIQCNKSSSSASAEAADEHQQRQTTLRFMPGLERHRVNGSYWHQKKRKAYWTVEWRFPLAQGLAGTSDSDKLCVRNTEPMDEEMTLCDILRKVAGRQVPGTAALRHQLELGGYLSLVDNVLDERSIAKDLIVLIRDPDARNSYWSFDTDMSLRTALQKKTVLEFPTFIVYPRNQLPADVVVHPRDVHDDLNVDAVVKSVDMQGRVDVDDTVHVATSRKRARMSDEADDTVMNTPSSIDARQME